MIDWYLATLLPFLVPMSYWQVSPSVTHANCEDVKQSQAIEKIKAWRNNHLRFNQNDYK